MFRFRYTAWDGRQAVKLDADAVFKQLSEYLSRTDDLTDALDRFLRDGMSGESFEIAGIDDILEDIRKALEQIYDRYDISHALDRHRELLDDVLDQERGEDDPDADAGESPAQPGEPDEEGAPGESGGMPPVTSGGDLAAAIRDLASYRFRDRGAARDFDRLAEDADDVSRLTEFQRRYGRLFRGKEQLDFDDALELIDRIEALKRLEEQLAGRELADVDLELVAELLGDEAAAAIEQLAAMLQMLVDAGYIRPRGSAMVLSPKGARRLGQLALREIYASLQYDSVGRHDTSKRGPMEVAEEAVKPYEFGDPMEIDVGATLRNTLMREPVLPLRMSPADLAVREATYSTSSATVLLLDMSWSMSWEGRFAAAKKVALAMETLMRTRFPRDYFAIVGFYTRAVRIEPDELPEVTWNMGDPFTNLQDGLRMASEMLGQQRCGNKSIIVITDGQPTAYFAGGRLYCEWPMSMGGLSTRATTETLAEVERVTRRSIVINTFMLDDSPALRSFVEKMTRINRGRAFYTTPADLGRFLLVDHVGKRRRVI